jgi:hypothetical protein
MSGVWSPLHRGKLLLRDRSDFCASRRFLPKGDLTVANGFLPQNLKPWTGM